MFVRSLLSSHEGRQHLLSASSQNIKHPRNASSSPEETAGLRGPRQCLLPCQRERTFCNDGPRFFELAHRLHVSGEVILDDRERHNYLPHGHDELRGPEEDEEKVPPTLLHLIRILEASNSQARHFLRGDLEGEGRGTMAGGYQPDVLLSILLLRHLLLLLAW